MLNRLFRKTLGPEYRPYFKSDLSVREAVFWRIRARKLQQAALINGDGPPGRVVLMNAIFLPGASHRDKFMVTAKRREPKIRQSQ